MESYFIEPYHHFYIFLVSFIDLLSLALTALQYFQEPNCQCIESESSYQVLVFLYTEFFDFLPDSLIQMFVSLNSFSDSLNKIGFLFISYQLHSGGINNSFGHYFLEPKERILRFQTRVLIIINERNLILRCRTNL